MAQIPITVFTGFLGAGKTSIILSLLRRLPNNKRIVLLKNEFGDINVDSKLAERENLAGVNEILNGCLCCVLVGQMQNALLEIRDKYHPDRIIIETSGSAFPATLAFQIRDLEKQTDGDFRLDAIATVIDAENFMGYEDTSPTAKMQASYTDLILINKWELVPERELEIVLDHLHTLNDLTPKIRCQGRDGIDPNLIFGLETKLGHVSALEYPADQPHSDEVQTLSIYRGSESGRLALHHHHHDGCTDQHCDLSRDTTGATSEAGDTIQRDVLIRALEGISKEVIWRIKGFVRLSGFEVYILNWAFGRYELVPFAGSGECETIRLTIMGARGEVKRASSRFATEIGAHII